MTGENEGSVHKSDRLIGGAALFIVMGVSGYVALQTTNQGTEIAVVQSQLAGLTGQFNTVMGDRYTSEAATRDWRQQSTLNETLSSDVSDLSRRMREMESAFASSRVAEAQRDKALDIIKTDIARQIKDGDQRAELWLSRVSDRLNAVESEIDRSGSHPRAK